METVYLGLGANLGDREANLRRALEELSSQVRIERVSAIYETEPVGYEDQPWFLNLVCRGETYIDPFELLSFIKRIESRMDRKESFRNAPRPIDIDILFFGDRIIESENLIIPHPRITERGFVLVPLAEIASALVHPQFGKTIKNLLADLGDSKQVKEWGHVPSIG